MGWVDPFHILHGYFRDDPQNPENFVKVSRPVSEIFGIFHFPKVSYISITESLYSSEYSVTGLYNMAILCYLCW